MPALRERTKTPPHVGADPRFTLTTTERLFRLLSMRSTPRDLTARAVIRDQALALFAARGPDAVTVREIAAAAGVSPGLIVHHYGSKAGLRAAVDAHVAGIFDAALAGLAEQPGRFLGESSVAAAGLSELMLAGLPPDSPVPAYLRRLLLSGDQVGHDLFRRWYDATAAVATHLTQAGAMLPPVDPAVRAAFLLVNDLAVLLLSDHVADVLGTDPLTPEGMPRWAAEVLSAYAHGVFVAEES
jgi:TetR/AcrR family transcriptional regulator, regulator of cefoperazone and chloramphenicol sensitivity